MTDHRLVAGARQALRRIQDEDGQGLVEYGMILMLVALVSLAVLQLIGVRVLDLLGVGSAAVPN